MNLGTFINRLVDDEGKAAMFQEFKIRGIGMQAQHLQIHDLHAIASELDTNLDLLAQWVLRADVEIKNLNDSIKNLASANTAYINPAEGGPNESDNEAFLLLQEELIKANDLIAECNQKISDLIKDFYTAN